jgi:hypothetical protein
MQYLQSAVKQGMPVLFFLSEGGILFNTEDGGSMFL